MLKEDSMVMDDGVTTRLADDHFHMTTTTGGAARVLNWLEEYLQTEWPELGVRLTSVTEQWAVASICGLTSRALLARLCPAIDLGNDACPLMALRDGSVARTPARVFRSVFTGELGAEHKGASRRGLAR